MADLLSLSNAQLKAKGHQLIEQLLQHKPEQMNYSIAKAHIYFWFNWFVLENVSMQFWYEGYHFSNMNRQQIIKVNEQLKNTTLIQILQQVQEVQQHLYATYQNRVISKTRKSKKGKKPAPQVHRITEEEFYYKIIFHDILYGNEEGITLLATNESKTLQKDIDKYLQTLSTEITSVDLKLAIFVNHGLTAWLKEFFQNPQSLEAITTFVRELLARAPMFQIPDETASSLEITAATAPLATPAEGCSQSSTPSPTATDQTKTPTKETPPQQKDGPSTKKKQRQQKYKQQRQQITQATQACFTDGTLQWDKYIQVLAIYEHDQQLLDLCYELLRKQRIAYNEQQYRQSKQQALQLLAQETREQIADLLLTKDSSSTTALSSDSVANLEINPSSQVTDEFQAASSAKSTVKTSTKPQHSFFETRKKPKKTKPLATLKINNRVIIKIKENNLAMVQKFYNQYQFTIKFTQHAILLACQFNCPNIFEFLITFCPQMINDSFSELYTAIAQGYNELLAKLLQHITTESQQDKHRLLELAIQKGNLHAVQLLLTKYPAMLKQLLYNNSFSPLHLAAWFGHTEIFTLLLKAGADQNQLTIYGDFPLLIAARRGNSKIVKLLLHHGINPNQTTRYQETPLLVAAGNGHTKVVKLLLAAKADPNKGMFEDITPFIMATLGGHIEIIKLLSAITTNIKLEAINYALATTFNQVLSNKISSAEFAEILPLFLKKGAEIDYANQHGNTYLMIATAFGQIDLIKVLLQHQADPTKAQITKDGVATQKTAISIAEHQHNEAILGLLQAAAARRVTAISQTPLPSFTPALTSQGSRTLAATSYQVASAAKAETTSTTRVSETETPTTTSQQASYPQEKPAPTKTAPTP